MKVGIIGCGYIVDAYLSNLTRLSAIQVSTVADLDKSLAERVGAQYGIPPRSVEALLMSYDVDVVQNLTVPAPTLPCPPLP